MSLYRSAIGFYTRADWQFIDLRCLLFASSSTYVFDETHEYVSDLTPGSNELSVAGYSRLSVATSAPTWDAGNSRWQFLIDTPVFPSLGTTEQTVDVCFYDHVTNDSDSMLIAFFDTAAVTLDGTDFTVNLPTGGWLFTMGEP